MSRAPDGRSGAQVVGGWLTDLHIAAAGANATIEDRKAKVAALTGALLRDFPDVAAVFCRESLHELAKRNKFFPSYAELNEQLSAWWERHRPKHFTEPLELDHASLSGEDRMAVIVWLQHQAANDLSYRDMTLRLAVIRAHHAPGFRWLIDYHAAARGISDAHQWHDPEPRHQPSEDETGQRRTPTPQHYAEMNVDEGIVTVPARPDPLDAPPDRAVLAQQFEATHGRKLGALSPEQLKATREANPASAALLKAQQLGEAEALRKAPFPTPEGRTFDVEPEEDKPAPEDIKPGANYAQPMPDGGADDAEAPEDSSAAPRDNVVPLYSPSWMQR